MKLQGLVQLAKCVSHSRTWPYEIRRNLRDFNFFPLPILSISAFRALPPQNFPADLPTLFLYFTSPCDPPSSTLQSISTNLPPPFSHKSPTNLKSPKKTIFKFKLRNDKDKNTRKVTQIHLFQSKKGQISSSVHLISFLFTCEKGSLRKEIHNFKLEIAFAMSSWKESDERTFIILRSTFWSGSEMD